MSEFGDIEGPRANEKTVHVIRDNNNRVIALVSRVEARNLRGELDRSKSSSVEVEDGEAHIGDKIWFIFSLDGEIKAAYCDENDARSRAKDTDTIAGTDVRQWNITKGKLYGKEKLEERRSRGFI
jgi:hypothetical protein